VNNHTPASPGENATELRILAQLISDTERQDEQQFGLDKIADADKFIERLDYHGITTLALDKNRLSSDVSQRLKSRTALMVANEALKSNALIELFESFVTAGLNNTILFKGSALAYSVYPQPWLRPRSDSDLFINIDERAAYEKVFFELGYQKIVSIEGDYVSYQNTFGKKLSGQSYLNIDLHWRINNRQILANSYSVTQLLSESRELIELSAAIKIPCAVDNLIVASLHRLGHHQDEERIVWLYDIHLLANSLSPSEWNSLVHRTGEKALSAITLDALEYCQRLFGTVIDAEILRSLQTNARQPEPSQFFLKRGLAEWRYFLHDIKALKSWRERSGLIIENLFPNPSYIRNQMGTKSALLGYLKRLFRGLCRILSA